MIFWSRVGQVHVNISTFSNRYRSLVVFSELNAILFCIQLFQTSYSHPRPFDQTSLRATADKFLTAEISTMLRNNPHTSTTTAANNYLTTTMQIVEACEKRSLDQRRQSPNTSSNQSHKRFPENAVDDIISHETLELDASASDDDGSQRSDEEQSAIQDAKVSERQFLHSLRRKISRALNKGIVAIANRVKHWCFPGEEKQIDIFDEAYMKPQKTPKTLTSRVEDVFHFFLGWTLSPL